VGRPGALGTLATTSFYPSKNLGAFGDGGAITTSDEALAERVRALRFHGSRDKVTYEEVGYNSRLDELQAAILRVQLPHLDGWAEHRRAVGGWYAEALEELPVRLQVPTPGSAPAWHLMVLRADDPDAVQAALAAADVQSRPYYRTPIHGQEAMRPWAVADDELPATMELARTHLAVPMSAALTREQVLEVAEAVRGALVA
jgi:dTDP-3-amino-3,4,6-trideoxy-alpha-D-glucose transaminase